LRHPELCQDKGTAVAGTTNRQAALFGVTMRRSVEDRSGYNDFMPIDDFKLIKRKTAPLPEAKPEILAAYIFGSVATGRPRPDSDIDIAVLVSDEVMGGRRSEIPHRS